MSALCESCGEYEAYPYDDTDPTLVCDGCGDYCTQCECAPRASQSNGEPEYKLCPQCRGSGKMVHPALSVWTESDRAADPDGFEDMMRGRYDVACDRCGGLRVVTVESDREYSERRREHFERLREQGIYPGNPDYL